MSEANIEVWCLVDATFRDRKSGVSFQPEARLAAPYNPRGVTEEPIGRMVGVAMVDAATAAKLRGRPQFHIVGDDKPDIEEPEVKKKTRKSAAKDG